MALPYDYGDSKGGEATHVREGRGGRQRLTTTWFSPPPLSHAVTSSPPPPRVVQGGAGGSGGAPSAHFITGAGSPNSGAAGAPTALPSKPPSNPQTAINGFIAMILTFLCFFLYLVWLLVPQDVLQRLHISYYPDKYWALAIPAVLTVLFLYYIFVSLCLVLITTNPLDDGRCVTDVDSRKDTEVNCGALTPHAGSVAPWADISVSVASTLLFQPWPEQP